MLDGSNDTGVLKMFPVTSHIFDINHQRIMTKFFDTNLTEGRDGVDNTNADIGENNSLKSRV